MKLIQKCRRVLVASLRTHDYIYDGCAHGERERERERKRRNGSSNICLNTYHVDFLFLFATCSNVLKC